MEIFEQDAEPDAERFLSAKERERRKWVEELGGY